MYKSKALYKTFIKSMNANSPRDAPSIKYKVQLYSLYPI